MTNSKSVVRDPEFKDRSVWLVVFGIFQILLGAICALMVPLMILAMVAAANLEKSAGGNIIAGTQISGALLFLILAVWFIWMGIGSIKAKRWARALILTTSCIWLVCGLIGFIVVVVFMPEILDLMERSGQLLHKPANIRSSFKIGIYIAMVPMSVIFLIIPGFLVLFYGSKNVKTTCEFRDQNIRWTDKCPLPVLALSLWFGFSAIITVLPAFQGCVIPLFGFILSGFPGAVVIFVNELLLVYLIWGTYKLKMTAWWGAVAYVVVWSISAIITFSRMDFMEFYEKMNYSEQQLERLRQLDFMQSQYMYMIGFYLFMLLKLGYLMYTRKFFVEKKENTS